MPYLSKMHPRLEILVSNIGEVFLPPSGVHSARWTEGTANCKGYRCVQVAGKKYMVHRLVAETFIGPIGKGLQIDHINRVRDDNRVSNLRIVTQSKNMRNTSAYDQLEEQGRTHKFVNFREHCNQYRQMKSQSHKLIQFADGTRHYVPLSKASFLLSIPVNKRIFNKQ